MDIKAYEINMKLSCTALNIYQLVTFVILYRQSIELYTGLPYFRTEK